MLDNVNNPISSILLTNRVSSTEHRMNTYQHNVDKVDLFRVLSPVVALRAQTNGTGRWIDKFLYWATWYFLTLNPEL